MRVTTKYTDGNFQYEFSLEDEDVIIFVLTGSDEDYGYSFPLVSGKIDWSKYPENAVLLSDNVRVAVEDWIETSHV